MQEGEVESRGEFLWGVFAAEDLFGDGILFQRKFISFITKKRVCYQLGNVLSIGNGNVKGSTSPPLHRPSRRPSRSQKPQSPRSSSPSLLFITY